MGKKLIPVYYTYDTNDNSISLSGKDYTDYVGQFADGANGIDGIVNATDKKEPYNYFAEINKAMWDLDHMENYEGNYDIDGFTVEEIISEMKEKGFELIEDGGSLFLFYSNKNQL